MDFFQKMMMMRKLRFNAGEISLFESRLTLCPAEVFSSLTLQLLKNRKSAVEAYENVRIAVKNGWAGSVKEFYKPNPIDYMLIMFDIGALTGWGQSKLIKFDAPTLTGFLRTFNAPVASSLKGKVSVPADFFWRAQMAGVSSAIFKKEMDFAETKCAAFGGEFCEFAFFPRSSPERKKYKEQFP